MTGVDGAGVVARLSEALDALPVPAGLVMAERTKWSNRAYGTFTGGPAGEGEGLWPWHPDDLAAGLELGRAVRATGRPASGEFRLRRADGVWRWMLLTIAPAGSHLPGVLIATAVDIHERREAEAREERMNRLLRASLDNLLDGFGLFVADGERFPALYIKSTGTHHPPEVMPAGLGLFDILPAPIHAWVSTWVADLVRTGSRDRQVVDYTDVDGHRRVVEMVAAVTGEHLVASWRYITDQVVAAEALARAEARLRSAFDSGGAALAFVSPHGTLDRVNPAFCELAGRPPEDLLGRRFDELIEPVGPGDPPPDLARAIVQVNAGGELVIVRPDGRRRLVVGHIQPIRDGSGRTVDTFVNLVDVTDHRQAEARLAEVAAAVPGLIFVLQPGDPPRFDYLSPGAGVLLGAPVDELLELPLTPLVVHPDDRHLADRLLAGHEETVTLRVRHRDGRWLWLDVRVRAQRDGRGQLTSLLGVALDVTRLKEIEADLLHRATHDPLTGLPNRSAFSEHTERVLTRWRHAPERHVAVLFCDLDRFKVVNDGLGHGVGDELLVAVTDRLRSCLRPADFLARQGGDEFTVLLDHLDTPAEAVDIAERLRAELDRPIELGGRELRCPVSVGIAFATPVTSTATDLLRHADAALARAKELGRNRIELFDDALRGELVDRLEREVALRAGLETGEITVHYQPEVDLATGLVVGLEALARWERPGVGTILPSAFVPLAEETGLIVSMGERVLRRALGDLAALDAAGHRLELKVNLSPLELQDAGAADRLLAAVRSSGLAPGRLCLEVTESVFVGDTGPVVDTLSRIRAAGVRIALDDFGTGYSSLSQLRRLPIDVLKIDRSFVEGVAAGRAEATIVRTILDLGRALDLEVTAEGVETPEQVRSLVAMGCRRGQGWHFGGAVPVERLTALLAPPTPWVSRPAGG